MRTFIAKKITVIDEQGKLMPDVKFSHMNLAMQCLNSSAEGLSVNDMRNRFKVIDKLESLQPDESCELTDTEWATLKECVNKVDEKRGWPQISKDIVEFVDAINAEEIL